MSGNSAGPKVLGPTTRPKMLSWCAMRHLPTLHRVRRRPVPPAIETTFLPGGGAALDIGTLLHQLEMREMLQGSGVRGRM